MNTQGRLTLEFVHVARGEGDVRWVFRDRYTFKAEKKDTYGAFGLLEVVLHPGSGAPPHTHHGEDEAAYILEGSLEVRCEGHVEVVGTGSFVFLPRGKAHSYSVLGDVPVKLLAWYTPGGAEGYFKKLGISALNGEPRPPAERLSIDTLTASAVAQEFDVDR
ncbi:cupin domain-containing protein [Streptomyces sp. NPDC014864]|uniref:cupin domain-containing protein n=1 Tax=Streptomyces sp. NPDC014864 TaxID=3364924 RepID=UPI0036FD63F7